MSAAATRTDSDSWTLARLRRLQRRLQAPSSAAAVATPSSTRAPPAVGSILTSDPTAALPFVLVLLLALSNLVQTLEVLEQVQFLSATDAMYGSEFSKHLVDDVLAGDEFSSGLFDVVGQTLGEILLAPQLIHLFELVLDAALAQTVGRRLVPLLIIVEAFGEAIGEIAGQGLGSAVAEALRPASDMLLNMLG
jgi:hypothetical protein